MHSPFMKITGFGPVTSAYLCAYVADIWRFDRLKSFDAASGSPREYGASKCRQWRCRIYRRVAEKNFINRHREPLTSPSPAAGEWIGNSGKKIKKTGQATPRLLLRMFYSLTTILVSELLSPSLMHRFDNKGFIGFLPRELRRVPSGPW